MFTIQEIRTSEKMYEKNMEVMNGNELKRRQSA